MTSIAVLFYTFVPKIGQSAVETGHNFYRATRMRSVD